MRLPTDIQRVFLNSPVNGANYIGDDLPRTNWQWPRDTYLQRRMIQQRLAEVDDLSGGAIIVIDRSPIRQ